MIMKSKTPIMEKIMPNHYINDTNLLIHFLKGQLSPQEDEKIRAAMAQDNLLKEVVEGLEIGLKLETEQVSLQEELSKSEEELIAWMERRKEETAPYPNPKVKVRLGRSLASLLCIVLLLCPSQAKYADGSETTTTKALQEKEETEQIIADLLRDPATLSDGALNGLLPMSNIHAAVVEAEGNYSSSGPINVHLQTLSQDRVTIKWQMTPMEKEIDGPLPDPPVNPTPISTNSDEGHVLKTGEQPTDQHNLSAQKMDEQDIGRTPSLEDKTHYATDELATNDPAASHYFFDDQHPNAYFSPNEYEEIKRELNAFDIFKDISESEALDRERLFAATVKKQSLQFEILMDEIYEIERLIANLTDQYEEAEKLYQLQLNSTRDKMLKANQEQVLAQMAILKERLLSLKKERKQKEAELRELEAVNGDLGEGIIGLLKSNYAPDRQNCSAVTHYEYDRYGNLKSIGKSNKDYEHESSLLLLHEVNEMLRTIDKQEADKKRKALEKGEWIASNKFQVNILKTMRPLIKDEFFHIYKDIIKDGHQMVLLDACHSDPKDFKSYFREVKRWAKQEEKRTNIPVKIIIHYSYVKSGYDQSKNIRYADNLSDPTERSISVVIDQACSRGVSKKDYPDYSPGSSIQYAESSDYFKLNSDYLLRCSYLKGLADAGSRNMDEWVYGIAQYDQENPYLGVLLTYSLEEDKAGLFDKMR
jgi:hypothetical protein